MPKTQKINSFTTQRHRQVVFLCLKIEERSRYGKEKSTRFAILCL